MEEMTLPKEPLSAVEQTILSYFETHDLNCLAEDVVYTNLNSGEVHTGRADVGAMLHYMYHVAFEARALITNLVVSGNHAVVEAMFKGKHIGEIQGIQATNREVNVPMTISYDLENGLI